MPVADEDAFAVKHFAAFAGVVGKGGVIFIASREGIRQLAGGVDVAKEDGGDSVAAFLPGEKSFHDGGDAINPGVHGEGRAVVQDDDGIGISGSDLADKLFLRRWQVHTFSIEPLALVFLGKSGEDDSDIGAGGSFSGTLKEVGGDGDIAANP